MKVVETKPDQERINLIKAVTSDAARYLGINLVHDSPQSIMKKVNDTITSLVFNEPTSIP